MVVNAAAVDEHRVDAIFQALADPTRRDIAMIAMSEEHSVSSLARRYPMSVTAVQKHVGVLERAGLVSKHRNGREQLVRGDIEAVREAFAVLDRLEAVWRARLGRFGDVLAATTDQPPTTRSRHHPTSTSQTGTGQTSTERGAPT